MNKYIVLCVLCSLFNSVRAQVIDVYPAFDTYDMWKVTMKEVVSAQNGREVINDRDTITTVFTFNVVNKSDTMTYVSIQPMSYTTSSNSIFNEIDFQVKLRIIERMLAYKIPINYGLHQHFMPMKNSSGVLNEKEEFEQLMKNQYNYIYNRKDIYREIENYICYIFSDQFLDTKSEKEYKLLIDEVVSNYISMFDVLLGDVLFSYGNKMEVDSIYQLEEMFKEFAQKTPDFNHSAKNTNVKGTAQLSIQQNRLLFETKTVMDMTSTLKQYYKSIIESQRSVLGKKEFKEQMSLLDDILSVTESTNRFYLDPKRLVPIEFFLFSKSVKRNSEMNYHIQNQKHYLFE